MRGGAPIGIWIGIVMMTATSGCSAPETRAIKIDGHIFDVPRAYLIEERIPWLPQAEQRGFIFYVNPEAPTRDRITVLIESRNVTCRSQGSSEQLNEQCAYGLNGIKTYPIIWRNVRKVQPNGDSTQWSHVYDMAGRSPVTIASCFAMADEKDGMCTALGSYNDLVFTLRVRESQVNRIQKIKQTVSNLLSKWEIQ